jgi:predicted alpha/beta hydrolase
MDPRNQEQFPIAERDVTLTAADGYRLGARWFEPRSLAWGSVVINGATATSQRYYSPFARYLAGEGLRVLTFDYRGVGRSRPPSLEGFSASMTEWARLDASAAFAFARAQAPSDPVGLVGHSFGAQLVGLVDDLREADAAIFAGGQLGYYGHWGGVRRLGLGALWLAGVPLLTAAYGYLPGRFGLGEDLPLGVAREWARWCRSPGYLIESHADAVHRFRNFQVPTLSFGSSDDLYAPLPAIRALLERLPPETVTHRQLEPTELGAERIGHFGYFRKNFEQTVWRDMVNFVSDAFEGRSRPKTGTSTESGVHDRWV